MLRLLFYLPASADFQAMAVINPKNPLFCARIGKRLQILLAGMFLMVSTHCVIAAELAIIPTPASMVRQPGEFRLGSGTAIVVPANDEEAKRVAGVIADLVRRSRNLSLPVRSSPPPRGAIILKRDRTLSREAYHLSVESSRITIAASSSVGLLYGGISLWQLLYPADDKAAASVPAVVINDAPRFAWRGVMLDSSRHFQSPAFVKDFIDWMALHKLNVLHWHLTDDQAWRLEIRKYPLLTTIGAWRVPAGAAAQADIDPATGKPRLYGGFYTQATVREIVAHAKERGITIVPEIELPGHASAALAAYPVLGAMPLPHSSVPSDWGIYSNLYIPAESTFRFLEDVLTEVMALFPSTFIHVGGDEVVKEQWQHSPAAQARMRELGIADAAKLQTYFTQRIGRFLQGHGRRLVGWDEILEEGLPASAVVMSWRGIDGALTAAAKGYDTVLSPWPTLYFDNRQNTGKDEPPGRVRVISVEDVYRFDPLPPKLEASQHRHVLGLQGNVWTEHIRTEERVGMMTFPRAAAVAEVGWSLPARRQWPDFLRRLAVQTQRYQALAIPHADSAFAVQAQVRYARERDQASVELANQTGYGDIRFTLDGREPSARSPRYDGPLSLPLPRTLRAATFAGEARLSRTRAFPLRRDLAQHRTSHELKLCSENIALALEDDAPVHEPQARISPLPLGAGPGVREETPGSIESASPGKSRSGNARLASFAGSRAIFMVDIQNPCWIFPQAELDRVTSIVASVGQVPFNFQIGEDIKKIQFPQPVTPEGELEIRIGDCKGELLVRLPLAPAMKSHAVTLLPRAEVIPRTGRHDLCLRFAQPTLDPLWVLDSIQLLEGEPTTAARTP